MPPRYSYWTIIAGGLPTAFRAADRAELMPTFQRLKEKHPDAELRWFARGKLWDSPEAARAHRPDAPRGGGGRGHDWRPGGEHRDPRQKFKDAKQARNRAWRQERFDRKHGGPGGPPEGRGDGERRARPPLNEWAPRDTPQGGGRPPRDERGADRPARRAPHHGSKPPAGGRFSGGKPGGKFGGGPRRDAGQQRGDDRRPWTKPAPQPEGRGDRDWRTRADRPLERPPRDERDTGQRGKERGKARGKDRPAHPRERPQDDRRPWHKPHGAKPRGRGDGFRRDDRPHDKRTQGWRPQGDRPRDERSRDRGGGDRDRSRGTSQPAGGRRFGGSARPFTRGGDRRDRGRNSGTDEPTPPPRPPGPNREPRPSEDPPPGQPPRPSEPSVPPPGPPERGRRPHRPRGPRR